MDDIVKYWPRMIPLDVAKRSQVVFATDHQSVVAAKNARIRELEAALREIADFAEQFIADDEDGDERMYKVHQIADNAIPYTADREAKP